MSLEPARQVLLPQIEQIRIGSSVVQRLISGSAFSLSPMAQTANNGCWTTAGLDVPTRALRDQPASHPRRYRHPIAVAVSHPFQLAGFRLHRPIQSPYLTHSNLSVVSPLAGAVDSLPAPALPHSTTRNEEELDRLLLVPASPWIRLNRGWSRRASFRRGSGGSVAP
jgi:hypothetical protein